MFQLPATNQLPTPPLFQVVCAPTRLAWTCQAKQKRAQAQAAVRPSAVGIGEISFRFGSCCATKTRSLRALWYASGGSLRAAAPALQTTPRESVRLLAKVARAVAYAHDQGILHRDLQPGNILLDGNGEPMVSDFGLAKWLDARSDLTRTLTTFGTPGSSRPSRPSARPRILPRPQTFTASVRFCFIS